MFVMFFFFLICFLYFCLFFIYITCFIFFFFFFSSRRRHTRCALVTGVQTCALPISRGTCGGRTPAQYQPVQGRAVESNLSRDRCRGRAICPQAQAARRSPRLGAPGRTRISRHGGARADRPSRSAHDRALRRRRCHRLGLLCHGLCARAVLLGSAPTGPRSLRDERKSTRLNSSQQCASRMPPSAWKKKT